MKKSYLIVILMAVLYSNSLAAKTYTLTPGWNLLGAYKAIPTSNVLVNAEVKNILIYQDGIYLSTASNQFATIPEGSGFFVYVEASATITISDSNVSSSTVQKLDENLNLTESADWPILKIVDADLLVEMKASTYEAGLTYSATEATAYCNDLVIGSVSGWRLPSLGELKGLSSVYLDDNSGKFKINSNTAYYRSTNIRVGGEKYTFSFSGEESIAQDYESRYAICVKESN